MSVQSAIQKLANLADQRDQTRNAFIKHLLLMSSGLMGILVSLHQAPANNTHTRIAFALSILLLSLGILCLTIALFRQVSVDKAKFLIQAEELQSQIHNLYHQPKTIVGNPAKLYAIFEKIGYASLLLSVICLTIYAVCIA